MVVQSTADALRSYIEKYVESNYHETIALLKQLAVLPAPSGQEEKRTEFVLHWLHDIGAAEAFQDAAGNVVYLYRGVKEKNLTVIMAHMDVVCPDMDALPLEEIPGRLTGPGVRDDTANLVNMLMAIKFLVTYSPDMKTSLLFVADVGEEGLGNLKGSRQIYETYGKQIQEWISFDLNYDSMITRAVGSRRYRVSVRTKGGHSYNNFGEENAIAHLAALITDLYRVKTPLFSDADGQKKVTYNVGYINGGTSVNTIAQEASMLYEIRSESEAALCEMEHVFQDILEKHSTTGVCIATEIIGIRPGNGVMNAQRQTALEERCLRAISKYYHGKVICEAGSTDCNIPFSAGIPAVTIGTALGEGTHTREEWVDLESMKTGQMIALEVVLEYMECEK